MKSARIFTDSAGPEAKIGQARGRQQDVKSIAGFESVGSMAKQSS